jgi:uncharacterized protein (DUF433 family)
MPLVARTHFARRPRDRRVHTCRMGHAEAAVGLGAGVYATGEVAKLAHIEPDRLRRWIYGYGYRPRGKELRHSKPLVQRPEDRTLTFLDLVEVCFVKAFLDAGVTMPVVRTVQVDAAREFATSHPFSSKRFETDGRTIVERHRDAAGVERLLDLRRRQFLSPAVFNPLLKSIDYSSVTNEAQRWWPMGRGRLVVIDPAYSFGAAMVSNSRVPTRALFGAHLAGESPEDIAEWFGVDVDEVRAAIEFEESLIERRAS